MSDRYTGKIVIAERISPDKDHTNYYDGQYLITAATDHQLYGIKLDGAHGGLTVYGLYKGSQPLPLTGITAYRISGTEEPRLWMLDALNRIEEEIRQVQAGEKEPHWALHIYTSAQSRLPVLRELIRVPRDEPDDMSECVAAGPVLPDLIEFPAPRRPREVTLTLAVPEEEGLRLTMEFEPQ